MDTLLSQLFSSGLGFSAESSQPPPAPAPVSLGNVARVFRGEAPPPLWIQREQQQQNSFCSTSRGIPNRGVNPLTTYEAIEAKKLRDEGNTAFQSGDYHKATELYTLSINMDPTQSFTYANRSFSQLKLGNIVESVADAEEAVNLNPNSYKAYYRLGTALTARGDYRRALDSLRRANALADEASEKTAIAVALSKCESKLTRAPGSATRLLSSSSFSPDRSEAETEFFAPLDFNTLANLAMKAVGARGNLDDYQSHFKAQREIIDCRHRYLRANELLGVVAGTQLHDYMKDAEDTQEALRRTLKGEQRQEFSSAKKRRDESYRSLWLAAESIEKAILELKEIAKAEDIFCERFATQSQSRCVEVISDHSHSPSDQQGAEQEELPLAPTEEASPLEAVLQRRLEIDEEVQKAQQRFAVTEEAGRDFFRALINEERMMERLQPLLKEAGELNAAMLQHAAHIARTTSKELSIDRINELEAKEGPNVMAVKEDKEKFSSSMEEGKRLLERESSLEQERLKLERLRIETRAHIEWLNVCGEPVNKINLLENSLQEVEANIKASQANQQEIQNAILRLVNGDHPELAFTSIASGPRILRLVKGSGLWMNISLSDLEVVGDMNPLPGSNSRVFRARYRGEMVAVKEVSVESEGAHKRFRSEVEILARCHHPNVIAVKGVFFDGGSAFTVMPYFTRGTLKSALLDSQESVSWGVIQDLFRQLVSGVAYLHEQGVVHANLDPSAVFLNGQYSPVITDFRIALPRDVSAAESSPISFASAFDWEQKRCAPELLERSEARPTCASDMWSLGEAMYEVATHNACLLNPSLASAVQAQGSQVDCRFNLSPRLIGDERLAELIASVLVRDPLHRPTAYELLAHPYFCVSLNTQSANPALAKSDDRLEAVRSFIHAIRREHSKVLISVQRGLMVESIADVVPLLTETEMVAPIMVVFQGEDGIDEGALTTDMLNLYYEQLVSKHHALVCRSAEGEEDNDADGSSSNGAIRTGVTYLPANDEGVKDPALFELLGKVMVKNIVENRPLPLELNSAVLKFFCGAPVSILDMEEFDPVVCRHLKQLRRLSPAELEAVYLDFSSFSPAFLEKQCGGVYSAETTVNAGNVSDYVKMSVEHFLVYQRQEALKAMKKGFFHYPSLSGHLSLLSPFDLQLLLSGTQHIDVEVIQRSLEFKNFPVYSKTPEHLRVILKKLTQNNLRRFLQLCTSTAAIPTKGSMKKITVVCCSDTKRLPVGHGCVYQLDLPDYNDLQKLEEKLLITLTHVTDGFHIV